MPNRNETPSALLATGRGLEIYDFPVALEPLISLSGPVAKAHTFHLIAVK